MTAIRRLAAILAADVAGYSRLMGADEEGTLERLKALRRELIDPKMVEHHGRIVKTTGDGLLVEFSSVVGAVRCAVEVQQAIAGRNTGIEVDNRIDLRMGINLGDVIVEGDDLYGDGVNIAARIEALANPGGVFLSNNVYDHVRDRLPFAFHDLGEQQVKNIARPVRVYSVAIADKATSPPTAVTTYGGGPASPPSAPRLSIVVLPFANLSNDPEQEYFADGITDDLTTDLSRISGSFVIARNTAFTYKGKPVDIQQIGRDLRVHYVLEGSVRRTGDQVRVNVQLIDAETGAHIWADRIDTDRSSLAEAQNEITGRLAWTLNIELFSDASRKIERERAIHPDVRDLVIRGWAWRYRPTSITTKQEALRCFERALEIDPRSIQAKIGIARVLVGSLARTNVTSSVVRCHR